MRPPLATSQREMAPQWRTVAVPPVRVAIWFTHPGSCTRVATCGLSRPTNAADESLAKLMRGVTGDGGVVEGHDVALPGSEVRVVEVEDAFRQDVSEPGRGRVVPRDLHLKHTAAGAVLGLDLHGQAGALAAEDDVDALALDRDVAGQDESPVIGRLAIEDDRAPVARDIERVWLARQRPVLDRKGFRNNGELHVSAVDHETRTEIVGRDRDFTVAPDRTSVVQPPDDKSTALAAGG